MPRKMRRTGRWPGILVGTGIAFAICTPAWGDAYLDALAAEAEEGGANVDQTSVTLVSMDDLKAVLDEKMPATSKRLSKLSPEVQAEILDNYRKDFDIYKVSLAVMRQSRNRAR